MKADSQKIITGLLKISSGINDIISILSNGALGNEAFGDSDHDKMEKKSRKKVKRDPNAPKPAASAYQLFVTTMFPVIKSELPNLASNEYFKVLGQRWKVLSESERSSYMEKAELSKQEYQQKMKLFQANGTCETTPSSSPLISAFDPAMTPVPDEPLPKIEQIIETMESTVEQHKHSKKRSSDEAGESVAADVAKDKKKKKKKKKRMEEIQS